MKRDGALTSLWQYKMPDYISQTHTISPEVFDVIIVGGGITGITTALQLQKAGKKCIIAEAQTIGFGTSGGTTAHLNTFMDNPYSEIEKDFGEQNAKLEAGAAREALDLVKKNIAAANTALKIILEIIAILNHFFYRKYAKARRAYFKSKITN